MRRREGAPVENRRQVGAWASAAGDTGATAAAEELERVADLCGRIDVDARGPDLARTLLEPIVSFVRAETASLRCLDGSSELPVPRHVASVGISESVGDAYMARYHKFDPARRLLRCSADEPVFADPARPGVWARETVTPALMRRYRQEFAAYLRGFLIPNDLVQHVGFSFRNQSSQILLFDFHRGRRASPFKGPEVTRVRVVARYLYARAMNGCMRFHDASSPSTAADGQLSSREFEVAESVARGLSNKEVAATLGISVRTVENHMRSIFTKLGVSSRTRLAAELRRAHV